MQDQHRLKMKKKLLDRKTEEAVSLAQNSGRSDLIPSWCRTPDSIKPPVPSPPPQSEAVPLEDLELSAPKKEKMKKKHKKAHRQESLGSRHADEGPGTVAVEVPQKEEDRWLFSLMDHLEELGISCKLPEGWADFQEEEFNLVITDALAAVGIEKSDLPEGWTMVIRRRKRKTVHTLPNIPEFFVGEMHKHPSYQEPEEQWEWEVSIHSCLYNLTSDDTFDMLENLPRFQAILCFLKWYHKMLQMDC